MGFVQVVNSTLSLRTRSFTFSCISLKHASFAWNKNREKAATKKGRTSNKTSSKSSLRYGHVILVSGCLVLAGVS